MYGGLLGGFEAAAAWGRAEQTVRGIARLRRLRELAQALARWEGEGGGVAGPMAPRRPLVYCRVFNGVPTPSG